MNGFNIAVGVFGGLGLFLYGMKIMSEALQMATGDRLKSILWKVTNNRFTGVLTGMGITSIIQSSSATTVMLVSFVSAGLITLSQSVGIILGANIGTTTTGWLVALFGFKVHISSFALPAIGLGFFVRFVNNEKLKHYGEVLLGFGVLFFGLDIMSGAVRDLRGSEAVMNFMSSYHADTMISTILVVSIGTAVTMVVQSSSATMAMTMTMAVHGIIDFTTACALVLGENIGTTITANIASIGASTDAKRSARVHVIFNVIGVCWVLAVFHWGFVPMVDRIVPGDPYSSLLTERAKVIADHLAAFHTLFNISNTILFLPFVNVLTGMAMKIVPERKDTGAKNVPHVMYITTNLVATPSINLNQAMLEIRRMMGLAIEMYDLVINVFRNPDAKLGDVVESIEMKENTLDLLEKEISDFLVKISQNTISQEQSQAVSSKLHMVNDLERIGDHCENLLRLLRRKYESKLSFSETARGEVHEIASKVREFLQLLMDSFSPGQVNILPQAETIEDRIDEMRRSMRTRHVERLCTATCDVQSGLIFIDMLNNFEKIGDHALNIAQIISGKRIF